MITLEQYAEKILKPMAAKQVQSLQIEMADWLAAFPPPTRFQRLKRWPRRLKERLAAAIEAFKEG